MQEQQPQLTEQALMILSERYLQPGESPQDMFQRVALAIAQAESDGSDITKLVQEFYDVMASGKFLPNSPLLMNGGLDNDFQYSACYVLPVEDSIIGVFDTVKTAAIVHKSGGGTGFGYSRLRPRGSRVNSTGGVASGPVSFMRVFDSATEAIKQGGRRRGANMGVLRVDHPDIEEFITCKNDGSMANFNISVALTKKFMIALEDGGGYDLIAQPGWPSPTGGRYEGGEVVGKKSARTIFALIRDTAWATGDPGLIFIDRVNDSAANPILGHTIEACNPCGEQYLEPDDACNLGSLNLVKFITEYCMGIDYTALRKATCTAIRFLDNVITVNPYPLPEIDKVVKANRRIGLGVMGWADLLFLLGIPYDSDKAITLAGDIMKHIKAAAIEETEQLAKERGPFPNWENSMYKSGKPPRNSTLTSIAPTGSISIVAGTSSGIEPAFALAYRHVSKQPDGDRLMTFINPVFERVAKEDGFWSQELMDKVLETGSVQGLAEVPEDVQRVFVTAHEIAPPWHVRMQAAFQEHTDNGVSKTINLPADATRQQVEDAYLLAYTEGCLGITVFRDGCKGEQVLNVGIADQKIAVSAPESPQDVNTPNPTPKSRSAKLGGVTYRKNTPVGTAYITVNSDDDGPFEVFINVGMAGSDVAADAEGLGRLISLALRSGLGAGDVLGQLRGIGSGRQQGFGPHRVMSLADGVAQALAEHVGLGEGAVLPGLPDEGDNDNLGIGLGGRTGDLCTNCGQATFVYEEGCRKCYGCGYSEC